MDALASALLSGALSQPAGDAKPANLGAPSKRFDAELLASLPFNPLDNPLLAPQPSTPAPNGSGGSAGALLAPAAVPAQIGGPDALSLPVTMLPGLAQSGLCGAVVPQPSAQQPVGFDLGVGGGPWPWVRSAEQGAPAAAAGAAGVGLASGSPDGVGSQMGAPVDTVSLGKESGGAEWRGTPEVLWQFAAGGPEMAASGLRVGTNVPAEGADAAGAQLGGGASSAGRAAYQAQAEVGDGLPQVPVGAARPPSAGSGASVAPGDVGLLTVQASELLSSVDPSPVAGSAPTVGVLQQAESGRANSLPSAPLTPADGAVMGPPEAESPSLTAQPAVSLPSNGSRAVDAGQASAPGIKAAAGEPAASEGGAAELAATATVVRVGQSLLGSEAPASFDEAEMAPSAQAGVATPPAAEPVGGSGAAPQGAPLGAAAGGSGEPAQGGDAGDSPGGAHAPQQDGKVASGAAVAEERTQPWGQRADGAAGTTKGVGEAPARRVEAREVAPETSRGACAAAADGQGSAASAAAAGEAQRPPVERAEDSPVRAVELGARELDREMPGLLVEQARLTQRARGQELRVRVRPPELGEIRIGFQARDGGLTGHILAERESVRSWLEARVPAWREELASAGVKVDRIDVGLITQGQEGGHATPWQEGQPPSGTAAASGPSPMGRDAAESVQGQALGVNSAAGSGQIDYWA